MIGTAAARCAGVLFGIGLGGATFAEDGAPPERFPNGLWVFGDSCAAAAAGTVADGIVLTREGTRAPQSRCDFVQLVPGGDKRWAVIELCTGRDSTFARLSSLVMLDGGALVLATETGGELEFDRCPDPEPEPQPAEANAEPEAPGQGAEPSANEPAPPTGGSVVLEGSDAGDDSEPVEGP